MRKVRVALLALALMFTYCVGTAEAESGYPGAVYYDEYYEHETSGASGWVHINVDTVIRTRPESSAPSMERVGSGSDCEYMNRTQYDSRGVAWYCVYCYGYLGWISAEDGALRPSAG